LERVQSFSPNNSRRDFQKQRELLFRERKEHLLGWTSFVLFAIIFFSFCVAKEKQSVFERGENPTCLPGQEGTKIFT
jgi:hypothetical protein